MPLFFYMTSQVITYPYEVHYTDIHEGINIAYYEAGKGKQTILFIHGLANYSPAWKYQVEALSGNYRCIAIDLPGNGLSSRGDYPYTLFFYAECVKKFCEKLKLEEVVLAGHSMGGQIAIILSLRYPQLVQRLLLLAPAGIEYFHPHEKMLMQNMMSIGDFFCADEYHLESAIKDSFVQYGPETQQIINELKEVMKRHSLKQWRDMVTGSINGMLNEQVSPFLPEIKSPVLILFGEQDRLIPNRLLHPAESTQKIGKKAEAMIPDARFRLIKNAGHFLQIEKYGDVNEAILGELASGH